MHIFDKLEDRQNLLDYYRTPLTVATIGAILSIIVFVSTLEVRTGSLELHFKAVAAHEARRIDDRLLLVQEKLISVQSLFKASQLVTEAELHVFTESMMSKKYFDSILWLPEKTYGSPAYVVKQPAFLSLSPSAAAAIPEIAAVLRETKRIPAITISRPFAVGADTRPSHIALLIPFAKNGVPQGTLLGLVNLQWVYQPMPKAMVNADEKMIYLYETNGENAPISVIGTPPPSAQPLLQKWQDIVRQNAFHYEQILQVAYGRLKIIFVPTPRYFSRAVDVWLWLVLVAGFSITGLIGFLTLRQTRQEMLISKEVEEKTRDLLNYTQALERSNQELDDFAYIVSHDLREPLRGLQSFSHFLLEDYEDKIDAVGKKRLRTISDLAQRLDRLLDALLHYSRVGRTEAVVSATDLNEVVRNVIDLLSINLKGKNTTVEINGRLPVVQCNRVRIGEVFQNLIGNAIKYSDGKENKIEIGALTKHPRAPREIVFYVRDHGIGIQEKHLETVFKMFKRLHDKAAYGGGTGSGLAITKKIISQHGGKIWAESEGEGRGTTFFFTIPQPHI